MTRRIAIVEPYDAQWGVIRKYRRNPLDGSEPIFLEPPLRWVEVTWGMRADVIIDLATDTPHPLLAFDLTVEPNRIAGIPVGTKAIVGVKGTEAIDDGELSFAVDYEQTFRVILQHPLYAMWEGEVTCAPD